ncbi:MAG TPA: cobaltochelatase subunit CobT, partial [Sphingomicrobium sp.]|nr:cobaltochelatase subunit CobT [Sphingomicrobium sp.]
MVERVDLFRRALAGAARAIAKDPEVEVIFASDNAPATGKTARVPSPGTNLEPTLVSEARGAADSAALRLRFHDPRMHARFAPSDVDARSVFDALESARVEALGARSMAGVRQNLAQLTEARVRGDAIVRARSADEVPMSTAVGLIARERLTGEPPPRAAASGLNLVAPWIEEKASSDLDALALTLDDQAAFAKLSRRLLQDLELAASEDSSEEEPQEAGDEDEGDEGGTEDSAEQGDEGTPAGGDMEMRGEEVEDQNAEGESSEEMEASEEEASAGDNLSDSVFAAPSRRNSDLSPVTDYKAFTTRFDEIV